MDEHQDNCVFCDLLKNNGDETFIADFTFGRLLVNLSQTYHGRCLYIFKDHVKDISEADLADNNEFMMEMLIISKVLKKAFGFNRIDYATLGNEVAHYHWHLIPRYKHDLNYNQIAPWPHIKQQTSKEELLDISSKVYSALINYQDEQIRVNEVDNSMKTLKLEK